MNALWAGTLRRGFGVLWIGMSLTAGYAQTEYPAYEHSSLDDEGAVLLTNPSDNAENKTEKIPANVPQPDTSKVAGQSLQGEAVGRDDPVSQMLDRWASQSSAALSADSTAPLPEPPPPVKESAPSQPAVSNEPPPPLRGRSEVGGSVIETPHPNLPPQGGKEQEAILPAPAPNVPSSSEYKVWIWQENGDCLWRIAQKVYGDKDKWRLIYLANRDILRSPHKIYPKQKLRIPPPDWRP